MKKKNIILVMLGLFGLVNLSLETHAHSAQLDVVYDNCDPEECIDSSNIGDGYNEKWYELVSNNISHHIPHSDYTTTTIKYHFATYGISDTSFAWTTLLTSDEYAELKNNFVSSMQKWNNVYFYTTDSNGYIIKNKLVNIVEGSADDHNLIIYPKRTDLYNASTWPLNNSVVIDNDNGISHEHYSSWAMDITIEPYIEFSNESKRIFHSSTGAHEIGHVLGLRDIDYVENGGDSSSYHHEELLMGYSSHETTSLVQTEITYKDLVGVAITRGYHKDSDHKWIYGYQNNVNGENKLICSICNAVKYVSNLSDYNYDIINSCQKNHNISSGNMMAVASYGNKDYYKCKYCRYVAPFTMNVTQNYGNITSYNDTYHLMTNNVNGLSYTCLVEHEFSNHCCIYCGYCKSDEHVFSYGYYSNTFHTVSCICGYSKKEAHVVENTSLLRGTCLLCGAIIDLDTGIGQVPGLLATSTKRTINGSYILPNGVIVLVKADLDEYFDGTLIFYEEENMSFQS